MASPWTVMITPSPSMLPAEILALVISFIKDRNDLAHLMRASHVLSVEAERVLYSDILLTPPSLGSLDGLLDGLIAHPRRGLLVQSFLMTVDSEISHIATKINRAFRLMANLVWLRLTAWDFDLKIIDLADGCSFRLRRFGYSLFPVIDSSLPAFLASQPSIQHLELPHFVTELPLSDLLPNLSTVVMHVFPERALFTNRSISRLHWCTRDKFLREPWPALKVLRLDRLPTRFIIAPLCPDLRYLGCAFPTNAVRVLIIQERGT